MTPDPETTDLTLFVRTSDEEIARWNRRRIVDALILEAGLAEEEADEISKEVEKQIVSSGIGLLTTALVRELVDAKLIERGLEQARRLHARLGFPLYDVRQLLLHRNKENANVPHAPEGTGLALVEGIKRQYALHDVFSREVGDAHAAGDIHLHGLGYIDRPYSTVQSLEYLKRFGLRLPHFVTVAGPAKHAEVLLAHMVRYGALLQGHFAGVVGWEAVNLSFAPYLKGMGRREVEQFAQMLVYEFSQLTAARGGQAIFTDIHLCWEIPEHLADQPAIGPGGKPTGLPCGAYEEEARLLASALMAVYRQGDATGKPFIFPRPIIHLTDGFFLAEGHEKFLEEACGVAAAMGNPLFLFERSKDTPGAASQTEETPLPWQAGWTAIQNVTINLPRLGYRAGGNEERLLALLGETLDLAAKAHLQKRDFIGKLLALGDAGPLAMLAMPAGGSPPLELGKEVYLVGITGFNELVRLQTGRHLHEGGEALEWGLKVVEWLSRQVEALSRRYGMAFVLEQTPAESTAYRFARLDLKQFSPLSGRYVRGDVAGGGLYYTNSTHLHVGAPIDPAGRVELEGLFHPLFKGDAVTYLELGAVEPPAGRLADFIRQAFHKTKCRQLAFCPTFTFCLACDHTCRGLLSSCPACNSQRVDHLARISQYYSRVSGWNRGKRAELNDRLPFPDFWVTP